jgi:hypothetical protein
MLRPPATSKWCGREKQKPRIRCSERRRCCTHAAIANQPNSSGATSSRRCSVYRRGGRQGTVVEVTTTSITVSLAEPMPQLSQNSCHPWSGDSIAGPAHLSPMAHRMRQDGLRVRQARTVYRTIRAMYTRTVVRTRVRNVAHTSPHPGRCCLLCRARRAAPCRAHFPLPCGHGCCRQSAAVFVPVRRRRLASACSLIETHLYCMYSGTL